MPRPVVWRSLNGETLSSCDSQATNIIRPIGASIGRFYGLATMVSPQSPRTRVE